MDRQNEVKLTYLNQFPLRYILNQIMAFLLLRHLSRRRNEFKWIAIGNVPALNYVSCSFTFGKMYNRPEYLF